MATVAGGAAVVMGAASAGGAVTTAAFSHFYHSSPLALYQPWVPSGPDNPDPPHPPEPDMTFYPAYNGAGTATTTGLVSPSWNPWEWYGPNVLGDWTPVRD